MISEFEAIVLKWSNEIDPSRLHLWVHRLFICNMVAVGCSMKWDSYFCAWDRWAFNGALTVVIIALAKMRSTKYSVYIYMYMYRSVFITSTCSHLKCINECDTDVVNDGLKLKWTRSIFSIPFPQIPWATVPVTLLA